MTVSVTVLSKPNCRQCVATKNKLKKEGISFMAFDVTQDDQAMDMARATGLTAMPIVVVESPAGERVWGGYSPDKIEDLKKDLAATDTLSEDAMDCD